MIEFYAMPTPNCWRISIALEEMDLDYTYRRVDISTGEQHRANYRAIAPTAKIPAIVDPAPAAGVEPIRVFESGAILLYLAEKSGCFLPKGTAERYEVLQWLMWDLSAFGPYLGMCHAFNGGSTPNVAGESGKEIRRPASPEAAAFFGAKSRELYTLLDERLAGREYLCDGYSILDMSVWPHIPPHRLYCVEDLGAFPNLEGWYRRVADRPAVQRGFGIDPEVLAGLDPAFRSQLRDERI